MESTTVLAPARDAPEDMGGLDMLTNIEHIDMFHIPNVVCSNISAIRVNRNDWEGAHGRAQHAEIAKDLAEQIASGKVPVGSLLPTEFELLRALRRQPLYGAHGAGPVAGTGPDLAARKNVGTRVEASRPSGGFMQSLASVEDLAQFGATHVRVVRDVSEVVVDVQQAQFLGCPGGSRWFCASPAADGRRQEEPAHRLDRRVHRPGLRRDRADGPGAPQTLISELIESRYGRRITRIRQDIRASTVPPSCPTN